MIDRTQSIAFGRRGFLASLVAAAVAPCLPLKADAPAVWHRGKLWRVVPGSEASTPRRAWGVYEYTFLNCYYESGRE